MKCIKCGSCDGTSGTIIQGIKNSYRICRKCLIEETKDCKVVLGDYKEQYNKKLETMQRKEYLQKLVDNRLDQYLWEL